MLGKVAVLSALLAVASIAADIAMCPKSEPSCIYTPAYEGASFVFFASLLSLAVSGFGYIVKGRTGLKLAPPGTDGQYPTSVTVDCPHCGAPNSLRPGHVGSCSYCGETITAPTVVRATVQVRDRRWSEGYVERIAARLQAGGYSVTRGMTVKGVTRGGKPLEYSLDLFGTRTKWEASKLGRFTRTIEMVRLQSPSQSAIEDFSWIATDHGVAQARAGSKRSATMERNCLVVAVVVADAASEAVKGWISNEQAERRWKAFDFRVLVSGDDGQVYYCTKRPVWGAAYYRGFANYADQLLS